MTKRELARLITRFEDPRAIAARRDALAELGPVRGRVVGITGAPGAGKSTLLGALALRLIADPARTVAVVAVDPSSPVSGGALLGDRTRVRFPPGEPRLFFRSQASDGELGGVAPATWQVCRLLARLFDVVFVETVGVGQSEIEIMQVADRSYLVVPPLAGDHVQFMKAGIMELPDGFVVSKVDVGDPAEATLHALRAALRLARPEEVAVHRVSARTGEGVDALAQAIVDAPAGPGIEARGPHFLDRWVRAEHGRAGVARLEAEGGAGAAIARHGGFDAAQIAYARHP